MEKMKEIIRGFGCIIILWEIKKKIYKIFWKKISYGVFDYFF